MEEEFENWITEMWALKVLKSNEIDIAKLAFYRAYEVGFKDGEYASANYGWGN